MVPDQDHAALAQGHGDEEVQGIRPRGLVDHDVLEGQRGVEALGDRDRMSHGLLAGGGEHGGVVPQRAHDLARPQAQGLGVLGERVCGAPSRGLHACVQGVDGHVEGLGHLGVPTLPLARHVVSDEAVQERVAQLGQAVDLRERLPLLDLRGTLEQGPFLGGEHR